MLEESPLVRLGLNAAVLLAAWFVVGIVFIFAGNFVDMTVGAALHGAMVFGLIPAAVAHYKGQNFFGWWLYGTLVWLIATPHAIIAEHRVRPKAK